MAQFLNPKDVFPCSAYYFKDFKDFKDFSVKKQLLNHAIILL